MLCLCSLMRRNEFCKKSKRSWKRRQTNVQDGTSFSTSLENTSNRFDDRRKVRWSFRASSVKKLSSLWTFFVVFKCTIKWWGGFYAFSYVLYNGNYSVHRNERKARNKQKQKRQKERQKKVPFFAFKSIRNGKEFRIDFAWLRNSKGKKRPSCCNYEILTSQPSRGIELTLSAKFSVVSYKLHYQ